MKTLSALIAALLVLFSIEKTYAQLNANAGNDTTICAGSSVTLKATVTGGTPPYQYLWSDGQTSLSITISPVTTISYWLNVTDSLGTQVFDTVTVFVNQNPIIDTIVVTDATCYNAGDGVIDLTLSSGTSFIISLFNGNSTINTNDPVIGLGANTYLIRAIDSNNCSSSVETVIITEPDPINIQISSSSGGTYPDTLCVTATGGTPPYNYNYTGNANILPNSCFQLLSGNFDLTVTDANACTAVSSNLCSGFQVSGVVQNVSCNGVNDGAIDLTVNGGTPNYIYAWSNGVNNQDLIGLNAGTFSVTVTDANQCTIIKSFTIAEPSPINLSATVTNVSCNGGQDGSIDLTVSGGTTNYVYLWSPGAVLTEDIFGLIAGTYSVTVTDQNGCNASAFLTINEPDSLTAQITSSNNGLPETLTLTGIGGTPPYSYIWFTGEISQSITRNCSYTATATALLTDANNCSALDTFFIQDTCNNNCVWPGDADNNGIADNNDLLPIGLAYGSIGTSRCTTSIDWRAFAAEDWADTLASGTNYKHIDCDGNSVVNADDTLAIIQNFGLTHAKNNQSQAWRMNAPALLVDLMPQTVAAGETLVANLILGDTNIPATDVYGLAFTLNYDALVVDSTQTSIVFDNSWLGTATDKISIAKNLPQQGQIKCAITRIDKATRSGSGIIGKASFVITTDNINGKNQLAYYNMNIWISDLKIIDNTEQELVFNEGSDSTQVEYEPISVQEKLADEISIYPNPTQNELMIKVSHKLLGGTVAIVDTEGKTIFSTHLHAYENKISTAPLANGVYYVKMIHETGVVTKRLVVLR